MTPAQFVEITQKGARIMIDLGSLESELRRAGRTHDAQLIAGQRASIEDMMVRVEREFSRG